MIQYESLGSVIWQYHYKDYEPIEVPWLVSREACQSTWAGSACELTIPGSMLGGQNCLVGSAEQGFVELMLLDALKPGKYQAITPCFRDEPVLDDLRHRYFMKLELHEYLGKACQLGHDGILAKVMQMTKHALEVFDDQTDARWDGTLFKRIPTSLPDKAFDIVGRLTGIEVGSYGFRKWQGHTWIYGTGWAEPRMTHVIREEDKMNEMTRAMYGLDRDYSGEPPT